MVELRRRGRHSNYFQEVNITIPKPEQKKQSANHHFININENPK